MVLYGCCVGVVWYWVCYSVMLVDVFVGWVGVVLVVCDGVLRLIFGGGDSCSMLFV